MSVLGTCPPDAAAMESLFPATEGAPTLEVAESAEAALRADLEASEEWLRAADTDVWTLPLSTLELSEIL